jgi:hypothetical protein
LDNGIILYLSSSLSFSPLSFFGSLSLIVYIYYICVCIYICTQVTADLGFIKGFRPPYSTDAPPEASSQALALESLFLNVDGGGDLATQDSDPSTMAEWQAAATRGAAMRESAAAAASLRDVSERGKGGMLAGWLAGAVGCLSRWLRGVWDACCGCAVGRWVVGRRAGNDVD